MNLWIWAICWDSKGIWSGSHHLNGGPFSPAGGSHMLRRAGGTDCHRPQYATHAVGRGKQGAPCPGRMSAPRGCDPLPAALRCVYTPSDHRCNPNRLYLLRRCPVHPGAGCRTGLCDCQNAGLYLARPLGGLHQPCLWPVLEILAGCAAGPAAGERGVSSAAAHRGEEEGSCVRPPVSSSRSC